MKKWLILFFSVMAYLNGDNCITYEFSGGRFGDNVLTYLHAKWLSYKYQMPLLYQPFRYSSELVLHEREILYNPEFKWRRQITLSPSCKKPFLAKDCLFICPYFPETDWEMTLFNFFRFKADWKDKEFRKVARELIAPNRPCLLTVPPEGVLSVAVHIRDGGSFDDYALRFKHPLKVPPLSFYITCLERVLDLFKNQQIYCYFFTDSLDPKSLVDEIQNALPQNAPIIFDYRRENNHDDKNVLEDFFSLFNFDILIRPASNFSIVPALIHDYALVFYPTAFFKQSESVTITEIVMDEEEELCRACRDLPL